MKSRLIAAITAVALSFSGVSSSYALSDDTFLSLTRRPTSVSSLPANISTISAQDIEDAGAKSLDEVINRVVGVQMSRSGSEGTFSTLRLRGSPSSAQTTIIIDDQPFGGFAADQNIDLSQIPVDSIDRIEVVRGGSSVLYGANTTGGVVHIITKKKPESKYEVSANYEARSYQTHIGQGEVGLDTGRFYGLGNVGTIQSDGFQGNSDVTSVNQFASFGMVLGESSLIGFETSRIKSESGVPQGTTLPISEWDGEKERAPANPFKRNLRDRSEARLYSDIPFATMGQLKTVFYGSSDSNLNARSTIGFFPDSDFLIKSHVMGMDTRFIGNCGFTGGFSYERDEQRSGILTDWVHATNAAGYVQHNLLVGDLSFIPALRYDNNSNFGSFWSPRFTAAYRVNDSWTLSGNIARSFRAPSFSDLYFDNATFTSNRNLKPEKAWTYDLGNEFRLGSNSTIKTVGFYTDIRDRIAGVNRNGDTINETNDNVSQSYIYGVEVEARATAGIFSWWGNYVFQETKAPVNSTPTVRRSHFVDAPLSPHHIANSGIDLSLPWGGRFTNSLRYVSKQYSSQDRAGSELPSYATWNTRLAKSFKYGEVYFGVNNILDRRYAESTDFDPVSFSDTLNPMPARNYFGGVSLKFGVPHQES